MNINNLTYAGRLVADPELRFTPANNAVCGIRVATNDRVKNKETGLWEDGEPTFLDVTLWGNSAEAVSKHFSKGSRIYLEGRITEDRWTDNASGQQRSKIKMTATRFQFVDSKGQGGGGDQTASAGYASQRHEQTQQQPAGNHQPVAEDDVPF